MDELHRELSRRASRMRRAMTAYLETAEMCGHELGTITGVRYVCVEPAGHGDWHRCPSGTTWLPRTPDGQL